MRAPFALRRRSSAAAVAALLALAACGGGKHHTAAPASVAPTDTTAIAPQSTVPSATATTAAAAGGPATTAGRAANGTTAVPTTQGSVPASPTVPTPIKAGTYTYSQTGSYSDGSGNQTVSPTGTLVADAAQPDGTQVAHLNFDPDLQPDLTYSFTRGGMFLVAMALRTGSTPLSCTFAAPVALPPWPLATGKTFDGNATCSFGEKLAISGSIGQPSQYAIPGVGTRTVWELDATITATGPAQATDTMRSLFSPDLRIPVTLNDDASGTFGVASFHASVQDKLKSLP
jgi:hypothetical protein